MFLSMLVPMFASIGTFFCEIATFTIDFDISQMFEWASMIVNVLKPVLYITMGLGIGFLIISKVSGAFNKRGG